MLVFLFRLLLFLKSLKKRNKLFAFMRSIASMLMMTFFAVNEKGKKRVTVRDFRVC